MFEPTVRELISWEVEYAERRSWYQTLCEIGRLEETPDREDAARRSLHTSRRPTGAHGAPETLQ